MTWLGVDEGGSVSIFDSPEVAMADFETLTMGTPIQTFLFDAAEMHAAVIIEWPFDVPPAHGMVSVRFTPPVYDRLGRDGHIVGLTRCADLIEPRSA